MAVITLVCSQDHILLISTCEVRTGFPFSRNFQGKLGKQKILHNFSIVVAPFILFVFKLSFGSVRIRYKQKFPRERTFNGCNRISKEFLENSLNIRFAIIDFRANMKVPQCVFCYEMIIFFTEYNCVAVTCIFKQINFQGIP